MGHGLTCHNDTAVIFLFVPIITSFYADASFVFVRLDELLEKPYKMIVYLLGR